MQMVLLTALGVGGATVFGSVLGFLFKKISHRFSDIVLSFAAGVMLCAAVTGLILPSLEYKSFSPLFMTVAGIFCGAMCLNFFDRLVPHLHRISGVDTEEHPGQSEKLNKILLFVMAIAIHNFPEGIATFTAGLNDPTMGLAIAAAVAIHNIPEGIAVSVPIFYATESRKKAFLWSLLSGLAEPLGALVAWLVLAPLMTPTLLGCVLTGVAGIMVYISLDELLPAAREYGEAHTAIAGVVVGMMIMAVSLLLL